MRDGLTTCCAALAFDLIVGCPTSVDFLQPPDAIYPILLAFTTLLCACERRRYVCRAEGQDRCWRRRDLHSERDGGNTGHNDRDR